MNAETDIRKLAEEFLAENQRFDGVRFLDHLLLKVSETGPITCTPVNDCKLRFQVGDQPPWEVELERARCKLRLLCARLGVLCNESGDQDVSLYGGEGLIRKACSEDSRNGSPGAWAVRFKNTMHQQEFTITAVVKESVPCP